MRATFLSADGTYAVSAVLPVPAGIVLFVVKKIIQSKPPADGLVGSKYPKFSPSSFPDTVEISTGDFDIATAGMVPLTVFNDKQFWLPGVHAKVPEDWQNTFCGLIFQEANEQPGSA